jgi:DNA-directed RNA polymerase subunit M/transcription elongation factor TFIIS
LSIKDYSTWLSNLLNIKIKLPLRQKEEMQDVYISAPLSLFYIDQDTSWNGALYKNTVNLQMYKSGSVPGKVFEYLLGISNDEIIDLEDKKTFLNNTKKKLDNQSNVLSELSDNFTLGASQTAFDESTVKNEIDQYLQIASDLGKKIKKYKSNIYSKRIKLDALLLDMQELDQILKYLSKSYEDIRHKCTQCNSHLTTEQSIQRMKLDGNKVSIQEYKIELNKKIKKLQIEVNQEESKKLDLEDEYKKLLSVAETKQGELTLDQYIKEKAKENTQNIYHDIRGKLLSEVKDIEGDIKEINKEMKEIKKSIQERKDGVEDYFKTLLDRLKIRFPKISLEYKFLEFKEIKHSGSVKNEVFLCLYMIYSKILLKYSNIKLPLVMDSFIKDELDISNIEASYKLVEETLLSSDRQTFFAMLEDKSKYIKNSYNKILLDSNERLLNEDKFNELEFEFSGLLDKAIDAF